MLPTSSPRAKALFVRQHDINATVVKDLVQKVIHHRDFNANEVDHDMHQRLMQAVEDGDIEVIDMWEEGDGIHNVSFVKRKVPKVLMELESGRIFQHQDRL